MQSNRTPFSTWTSTLTMGVLLATAAGASNFDRLGLVSVAPTPAPALDAQGLDGSSFSLTSLRGQWVVLTFWATWCGPCRSELPTLEAFHRSVEGRGVAVLGVSIDRRPEPIAPFLQRLGVSFPTVWDHSGRAARDWRASSIPLTWIVDPEGQLVAVSRGAKDWSRLGSGFLEAVLSSGTGASASVSPPPPAPEVARPSFEPPTATARVEGPVVAGRPFELAIEVQWSGRLEDYVLHPPVLVEPGDIELGRLAASTRSHDGAATVVYRQELKVREVGSHDIGPIEVRFTPRGETEPVAARIDGPSVTVSSRFGMRQGFAVAGVGASLAAIGGLAWWWRRRGARAQHHADVASQESAVLERIQRARLDGEVVRCLEGLHEVFRSRDEKAAEAVLQCLEKARYAGQLPPTPELDAQVRLAERLLAPAPDRAELTENRTETQFSWPSRSRVREERTT